MNFYVEVHRDADATDFYISHKSYGVKELMFGIPDCSEEMEEDFILNNACEYMLMFAKDRTEDDLYEELQEVIKDIPDYDIDVLFEMEADDE